MAGYGLQSFSLSQLPYAQQFFPTPLTICTTVFPHLITFCTRLMFNLFRVGKERASSVFPHPIISNFRFYAYSWQGKIGWVIPHSINQSTKFFPPDNLLHKVDVLPCQGGERMGRPSFSPPSKKQKLHVYSWQGKVGCVFLQMINHVHNSFPPPDNLLNKVEVFPCQGR